MKFCWVFALAVCAHTGILTAENTALVEVKVRRGAEVTTKKIVLHQHPMIVKMLKENNKLRERYGLAPHKISAQLTLIAQRHATWMARTGIFEHSYTHPYMEIIAFNYNTPAEAFVGWEGSPPHFDAMVSNTPYAGFGCVAADNGSLYWVGVYGTPPMPEPADVMQSAVKPIAGIQTVPGTPAKEDELNEAG